MKPNGSKIHASPNAHSEWAPRGSPNCDAKKKKGKSINAAISQGTAAHSRRCRLMEARPWVGEGEKLTPCAASSGSSAAFRYDSLTYLLARTARKSTRPQWARASDGNPCWQRARPYGTLGAGRRARALAKRECRVWIDDDVGRKKGAQRGISSQRFPGTNTALLQATRHALSHKAI